MKNYTFNFEVQTLLEQFVAAFNDIVIKRYDNTKTVIAPTSGHKVSFVYAPKQRVYDTLNTPAPGGMTVPVVAVSINGIARDNSRVFNKLEGFTVNNYDTSDNSLLNKIPQPVPVNIGISMVIVTKFQSDMDQIISNFVPYCDPYIIISCKLPSPNNSKSPYELRSEVLWDGNIQLQYPDNLGPTQPYRLTATTNFTIKGWLFKKIDETIKKIYTIDASFISNDGKTSENDPVNTKTSLLKDFDTVFGTSQGINVSDFSIQTTSQDIKNFKNTYSTVTSLSDGWQLAYDWVSGNSASTNDAVLYVQSNSAIELNQELATSYVIVNSSKIDSSYTTVNTLSSDWEMIYTYVTENSGIEINQQAVATLVNTNSAFWDIAYANTPILTSVYSTVQLNSANNWNYQGTDLKNLSSEWVGGNIAYTNLLTNSAAYLSSVDLSFLSLSSNWNSVYTNVNSNSSNWNIAFNFATQYSSNSAFDLAARTFVNSNSSNIIQVNTAVNTTSANWNNSYDVATKYQNTSGSFATNTGLDAASSVLLPISVYQSASGNWQSTFTNVQLNSATTWNYQGTDLKALSGNWQSTFSTVNSLSSNWNSSYNNSTVYANNSASYATNSFVHSNFFNLSGGIISGATKINNDLTVFGNLTATGTTTFANTIFSVTSSLSVLHIGSGPALWVGNNGDGDIASFYDIDQGIEILHVGGNNGSFPNVGVKTSNPNVDFTVNGQISANNIIWSVGGNSNNWNSVYSNVNSQSANNVSVYSNVNSNSANWNNVYSNVNLLSSDWNTSYNISTEYQNTSSLFATNTLLQSTSSLLTPLTLTNTLTSQLVLDTTLNKLSSNWQSSFDTVNTLSGNWDSTFSTVQSNSATTWNYQGTDLKNLSAEWIGGNIAYTNLVTNSAAYLSSVDLTLINATSANWDSVYTTVQLNSATTWNYQGTDLKALSGNWQNSYTIVSTNSAVWSAGGNAIDSGVRALTANWQNASDALDYILVNANFNAIVNRKYIVDTTLTTVSGLLPASPVIGDNILFVDSSNTWGITPLILDNNGNLLQTFNEPLTANISGYQFQLVYVGGSYGWKIV